MQDHAALIHAKFPHALFARNKPIKVHTHQYPDMPRSVNGNKRVILNCALGKYLRSTIEDSIHMLWFSPVWHSDTGAVN
jgi:hypothetical protein